MRKGPTPTFDKNDSVAFFIPYLICHSVIVININKKTAYLATVKWYIPNAETIAVVYG